MVRQISHRKITLILLAIIINIGVSFVKSKEIYMNSNRSLQKQTQNQWPIFKPQPIFSTDSKDQCHHPNNAYIQPFKINGVEYIALSLKSCGMVIFNIQDPNNPLAELRDSFIDVISETSKINYFTIDYTRNLLWIAHYSGNVYTVDITQKPFSVKKQFSTNKQKPAFIVSFIPEVLDYFLVFCFAEVQIYSADQNQNNINFWKDISNFKYYKTITLGNSNDILKVQFTQTLNLLFIGSFPLGLLVYQVQNPTSRDITLTLIATIKPTWANLGWFEITSKNILYLQQQHSGLFNFDINDCIKNGDQQSCSTVKQLTYVNVSSKQSQVYISKDENYIFTQSRAWGIQIFDISNRDFQVFQNIELAGDVFSITMNEDETLLFYTSAFQFLIYQKSQVRQDFNRPNILLNFIQTYAYSKYKENINGLSSDPSIYFDEKRNYIYVCRYQYGFTILKKDTEGIIHYLKNYDVLLQGQLITQMQFFNDYTTAYIPKNLNGLSIVDFTDPENPVYIKEKLKFGLSFTLFTIINCTEDLTLCFLSSQYTGILFLDTKDVMNPKLLSIFLSKSFDPSIPYSYSSFLKSQRILVLIVYNYGIINIDVSDPIQPKQISALFTDDATDIVIRSDDRYGFISSPVRGFVIIDLQDIHKPIVVASIQLFGAAMRIKLINNEQYILVTSIENPGLFLIDVTDISNPKLIQTYKRKESVGGFFDLAFYNGGSEGFLSNVKGVSLINLKNQVILHTEVFEQITQEGTNVKKYINLDLSQTLYVGQQIILYIIPIYENLRIQIKKVQLYDDYILQPLKSWMVFSQDNNILSLNIQKDALKQEMDGTYIETTLQIIFQVHKTLSQDSFKNTFLNIDSIISSKILNQCQLSGLVDEILMVDQEFNPQINLNIDLSQIFDAVTLSDQIKVDNIKRFITHILQHTIVSYPITFNVAKSLSFDPKSKSGLFVFSLKSQVNIYIRIKNKSAGRFVEKNYSGVLHVLSQQQDEIKIEGEMNKVNNVLQQKIKFFSQISQDLIIFEVIVEDGINYDASSNIKYKDAAFISEQQKVSINPNIKLEDDFYSKITKGEIYIQERFQYQISADLFIGDEGYPLIYSAKIKDKNGDYGDIPLNFWLQFSPTDRIFSGTPSQKEFNKIIDIQVTITDNYSKVVQEFSIKVYKIPFLYFVQFAIQIIGPLIGLIGIWKYKYYVYNAVQKKYYTYSAESVKVGDLYSKQILLNDQNLQIAEKMLKCFQEHVPQREIQKQIYYIYSFKKNINPDNLKNLENQMTASLMSKELIDRRQAKTINNIDPFSDKNSMNLSIANRKPFYSNILKRNESQENESCNQFTQRFKNEIIVEEQSNLTKKGSENDQLSDKGKTGFNFQTKNDDEILETELQFMKLGQPKNSDIKNPAGNLLKQESQPKINMNDSNSQTFKSRGSTLFQRRITKKIQYQIEKINKFQTNKINGEQQQRIQNKNQSNSKISSILEFELKIFDDFGNIMFDDIIEFLINRNERIKQKEQKCVSKLSEQHITELKNKKGLVRITFQCFLAEYILQQDQFTYYLFSELHKNATNNKKQPDWYKKYCIITPNLQDIYANPIPNIEFRNDEIIKSIKYCLFDYDFKFSDSFAFDKIPMSISLLQETIKAYAFGFISQEAKLKTKSSGESIKIETHQIKQITSFSKRSQEKKQINKGFFQYICNKLQKELIQKPLVDNSKLPSWVKSVDIINNNLLIIGQPEKKDVGSYHIFVFSQEHYILRAFEIQVIDIEKYEILEKVPFLINEKSKSIQNTEQFIQMRKNSKQEQITNDLDKYFNQVNFRKDNSVEEIQREEEQQSYLQEERKPHINLYTD